MSPKPMAVLKEKFMAKTKLGGGNEGRGQDDLEGGRGENIPRQLVVYPRLREMPIIVFAQTTAVIIAPQFRGDRILS